MKTVFVVATIVLCVAAGALAGEIKLAWDANTESDLAGYNLYYGNVARTGLDPKTCTLCGYAQKIQVGNVTSFTIAGLTTGRTYWLSATAYDTSGNESGFSNEVSGLAMEPAPKGLVADLVPGTLAFYFYPPATIMPVSFICSLDGKPSVEIPATALPGGAVRLDYQIPPGLTAGDHVMTIKAKAQDGTTVDLAPQHFLKVNSATGRYSYYYTYISCDNQTGTCR